MTADNRPLDTTLAHRTRREIPADAQLLVPIGALVWHGAHLPLDTDTRIAQALAGAVASQLPAATVAPPIWYGSAGSDADARAGGVVLRPELLCDLLLEYGRSVRGWASRVLYVNGHDGNGPALTAAVRQLDAEGIPAAWWTCQAPPADGHAGRTETSLLMHVDPTAVRPELIGTTHPTTRPDLMPRPRRALVSVTGASATLGDPTGSSAETGRTCFTTLVHDLSAAASRWHLDDEGHLR